MASKARGLADLGNVYSDGALSNRNMVINGGMAVAQRGTSFTHSSGNNSGYKTVDRWYTGQSASCGGSVTVTQSTLTHDGVDYTSLKHTVGSPITIGASNAAYYAAYTILEGNTCYHIKGKDITVSFLFDTNVSGVYSVALYSNNNYSYLTSVVAVAGVVERHSVSVPWSSSIDIPNSASRGFTLSIGMLTGSSLSTSSTEQWVSGPYFEKTGSVNWGASSGNYINITHVQLELGDTATPFEHRSYGDELARCQRYYQQIGGADVDLTTGQAISTTGARAAFGLSPSMRSAPSFALSVASDFRLRNSTGGSVSFSTAVSLGSVPTNVSILLSGGTGLTAGNATSLRATSASSIISFDAEL